MSCVVEFHDERKYKISSTCYTNIMQPEAMMRPKTETLKTQILEKSIY